MPNSNTYQFYKAYVINVRDFLIAEAEIRRTINRALKVRKPLTVSIQTKIYALLYSTFSEANFMKLILTPHGFDQEYVNQIIAQETIQEKWYKCLELAFLNFTDAAKNSHVPNRSKELQRIIQRFIIDPSVIRNKIPHGQLTVALNSRNTALNLDVTNQIAVIDFVVIYRYFQISKKLSQIIEDIIESPNKAHYEQYFVKYQELEQFIKKTEGWDVAGMRRTVPKLQKSI